MHTLVLFKTVSIISLILVTNQRAKLDGDLKINYKIFIKSIDATSRYTAPYCLLLEKSILETFISGIKLNIVIKIGFYEYILLIVCFLFLFLNP